MASERVILIYSPFPSLESARDAAHALLAEKLVACCNLLPGMESHYLWEGKPTQNNEILLIAKTSHQMGQQAAERLGALHPYKIPAILQLEARANEAFANWLGEIVA